LIEIDKKLIEMPTRNTAFFPNAIENFDFGAVGRFIVEGIIPYNDVQFTVGDLTTTLDRVNKTIIYTFSTDPSNLRLTEGSQDPNLRDPLLRDIFELTIDFSETTTTATGAEFDLFKAFKDLTYIIDEEVFTSFEGEPDNPLPITISEDKITGTLIVDSEGRNDFTFNFADNVNGFSSPVNVPEPSTNITLIAFGILGLNVALKHKL
jgi:hypothetical protein